MNEKIEQLEEWYEDQQKNRILSIYAGVFLLFFLLCSYMFVAPLLSKQQQLKTRDNSVQAKIDAINLKLYETKLKALENSAMKEQSRYERQRTTHLQQSSRFESMGFVSFGNKNFTAFLDELMKRSIAHELEIKSLETAVLEQNLLDTVTMRRSVTVSGNGRYGDIVAFLEFITGYTILQQVEGFSLQNAEEGGVDFSVTLLVGGVDR